MKTTAMVTLITLLCGSLGFVNLERVNMKRVVLSVVFMLFLFPFKGFAAPLSIIDSIPTQFNQNAGGIAWDGSTFWTQLGNQLYQYNLNGDVLGSISTPNGGGFTIGGFTTDGVSFFGLGYPHSQACCQGKLTLYQMDFSGNLLFSGQTEFSSVKGITWDGTYLRALSGNTIYTLDTNGNTINSLSTSLPHGGYGLAYDGQSFITNDLDWDRILRIDAQDGTILDWIYMNTRPSYLAAVFYGVPDFYLASQNVGGSAGVVDLVQIDWDAEVPEFEIPEPCALALAIMASIGLMLKQRRGNR